MSRSTSAPADAGFPIRPVRDPGRPAAGRLDITAQASTRRRPGADPGWDAVVVGARVAGASTALLLARAGLRVLVVDRARRGSDTLSTHALMRGGVLQLRRWGLLDRVAATGAPPVRRVTFHYGNDVMPVSLKPYAGVDALYAPRRTVLDAILVDAAENAGARFRFGSAVIDLARSDHLPNITWKAHFLLARANAARSDLAVARSEYQHAILELRTAREVPPVIEQEADTSLEDPLALQVWQSWLQFVVETEGADQARVAAAEAEWPPLNEWLESQLQDKGGAVDA